MACLPVSKPGSHASDGACRDIASACAQVPAGHARARINEPSDAQISSEHVHDVGLLAHVQLMHLRRSFMQLSFAVYATSCLQNSEIFFFIKLVKHKEVSGC